MTAPTDPQVPGGAAPDSVAVIDLGSNSFHLLVARPASDGTFETVAHHREQLALADTVVATGRIGPVLAAQAVRAVVGLCELAHSFGVRSIRACATHAFRQAVDAGDVLRKIRDQTGVPVEIITGEEEAGLVFTAVASGMALSEHSLIVDVGAGSLDFAVGGPPGTTWAASAPMGAAVLAAESRRGAPGPGGPQRRLARRVQEALREVGHVPVAATAVVGTGGTMGAVGRAVYTLRHEYVPPSLNEGRVLLDELIALGDEVTGMSVGQRQRRFGLSRRRADLLPAGVAIARGCLEWAGSEELTLCDWGVREGLVLRALGAGATRRAAAELRGSSVAALRSRYPVDEPHGDRVTRLAGELFDRTVLLHNLGDSDRELLRFGASLAEIGRMVNAGDYTGHSAYLVEHAGLRGFQPEEVAVLACLGRYHKGGSPKPDFPSFDLLSPGRRTATSALVALLQLAVALDYGRRGAVEQIEVRLNPRTATLVITANGSAELETGAVAKASRLFERELGRAVDVAVAAPDPPAESPACA